MFTKILQGVAELILAVAIILIFDRMIVMSWRGLKSGIRTLKNRRQTQTVVVES